MKKCKSDQANWQTFVLFTSRIDRGFFDRLVNKKEYAKTEAELKGEPYEFCPRCDANLTLQKGYQNDFPYWICRGCGEMLINPEVEGDIAWICDRCGAMLNIQDGFSDNTGEWICTECGYMNGINEREVYVSEDEYRSEQRNPYRGLSEEEILALSEYRDDGYIDNRLDIILVKHRETEQKFVKKLLTTYNRSVYDYLRDNPVEHMPVIHEIYESENCLIVIEQYIEGKTIADILEEKVMTEDQAESIAMKVCKILEVIHNLPTPIIHRDIKPSNIMVTPENDIYLLDMNVAKWYDPHKTDDTRYMGTRFYAAPEQVGYGLSASSAKSDIYALGILINVMVTGKFPREERAGGSLWNIIERCISLDADKRYSASGLREALEGLRGGIHAEEAD